jgi:hypothetical protein
VRYARPGRKLTTGTKIEGYCTSDWGGQVGNSRHRPLSRVRKRVCQGGGNDLHRTLHISDHATEVGTPEINAELEWEISAIPGGMIRKIGAKSVSPRVINPRTLPQNPTPQTPTHAGGTRLFLLQKSVRP